MKWIVVSYTFPPYNGIGGRRWAKFCKYLNRDRKEFVTIAAKKELTEARSPWISDITEYAENIIYVKSGFPGILTRKPKGIIEKIKYRLGLLWVKLRNAYGNYYDPSFFFNNQIKKEIEKRLKQGYDGVLVSCAPFRMGYEITSLKSKYPDKKFIVDFRDPWMENTSHYGFTTLSPGRKENEFRMQKKTIQQADKIFSVSREMNHYFMNLDSALNPEKFIEIPNGYDTDDIPAVSKTPGYHKLRFIFCGNYYNHCQHHLTELVESLLSLKEEGRSIADEVVFDFYGSVPAYFEEMILPVKDIIQFHGPLPLRLIYDEIASSHICTLFLTNDMTYSRSTKFYEYLGMKKSIAVFSSEGETGRFVEEQGLGYYFRQGNFKSALTELLNNWRDKGLQCNENFDREQFHVKHITKRVERELYA